MVCLIYHQLIIFKAGFLMGKRDLDSAQIQMPDGPVLVRVVRIFYSSSIILQNHLPVYVNRMK